MLEEAAGGWEVETTLVRERVCVVWCGVKDILAKRCSYFVGMMATSQIGNPVRYIYLPIGPTRSWKADHKLSQQL